MSTPPRAIAKSSWKVEHGLTPFLPALRKKKPKAMIVIGGRCCHCFIFRSSSTTMTLLAKGLKNYKDSYLALLANQSRSPEAGLNLQ